MREFINYVGAFGMNSGIIAKEHITRDDLSTYFWIMGANQFGMFALLYLGAPFAAGFFSEPRLVGVLRVVSLTFLISIFLGVSQTLLIKNLRFGCLNLIRASATLLESILAILLAIYTDLGYWALVHAMVASYFLSGILMFASARWLPKLRFDRDSFKYLFRFGINGLGQSAASYLSQNVDYLFVGRLFGAAQLGLYEFAYKIPHLIHVRVTQPIASVIFPSLSKVQASDTQLASAFEKTAKHVALLAFPALLLLAAIADVAVPVLWGEKWAPIIAPMRILCFCAVLRCVPQGIGAVFYIKDRPDLPFKIGLWGLAVAALCVAGLGYLWGLDGVALGMLLSVLPNYYAIRLAYRIMKLSLTRLLRAILSVAAASTACAAGVYAGKFALLHLNFPAPGTLLLSILAGIVSYPLAIYRFFPGLFLEIIETVQTVTGRKVPCSLLRLATPRTYRSTAGLCFSRHVRQF